MIGLHSDVSHDMWALDSALKPIHPEPIRSRLNIADINTPRIRPSENILCLWDLEYCEKGDVLITSVTSSDK